jgi:SPP1 gp7 family putative phage head morphogenesis protein
VATMITNRAVASIAALVHDKDLDAEKRRHGVILVLHRLTNRTPSRETVQQVLDVVPEEATRIRISNPQEAVFRAMYLVNAMKRKVENSAAIAQENHYLKLHVEAATWRRKARSMMNEAEKRWGPLLSWRAVRDDRATPDCLALDGKNFFVWAPPHGVAPGALHARCRCVSGPPINGAPVV